MNHAVTVMGDALYLAAGMRMGTTSVSTNDVWKSTDGDTWERLAADPPFPPRESPSLCAFRGKLWLIGGISEAVGMREGEGIIDAWTSADGRSWEAADISFIAPGTSSLLAIALPDRLWIIANSQGGAKAYSSPDGINFKEAKASLPVLKSAWSFKGGLYAWDKAGAAIYASKDGSAWTKAASAPAFLSIPGELGGVLYAICSDGIRLSRDSLSWTKSDAGAAIPGFLRYLRKPENSSYSESVREGAALVSFKGRLWCIAGAPGSVSSSPGVAVGGFTLDNDLWSSRDGKAWELHAAPSRKSLPAARFGQASLVHAGRLYVLGGRLDPAHEQVLADTWSMGPDRTWTAHGPSATYYSYQENSGIWEPRWRLGAASFKGRLWIAGGLASPYEEAQAYRSDVWSSEDGSVWRLETDAAAFGPRAGLSLVAHAGYLWAFGGEGPLPPSEPGQKARIAALDGIYRSADGRTWEAVRADPAPGFASMQSAASDGERIWIVGGYYSSGEDSYLTRSAWSSADGIAWRREPPAPAFFFGAAACAAPGGGLITAGGRDSTGTALSSMAILKPNGDWIEAAPLPWPADEGSLAVFGGRLWFLGGLDDADGPPTGAIWSMPAP
jgi:hypothetical protein